MLRLAHALALSETASSLVAAGFAVMFASAALAKLDGWEGWSKLVRRLPIPRRAAPFVDLAVPAAEACVALVIIIVPATGLLVAAGVLLLFAVAVAVLTPRLRGEKCNCFGAASSTAVGGKLAMRNAALGVTAGAAGLLSWQQASRAPSVAELAFALLVALLLTIAAERRRFVDVRTHGSTGEPSPR